MAGVKKGARAAHLPFTSRQKRASPRPGVHGRRRARRVRVRSMPSTRWSCSWALERETGGWAARLPSTSRQGRASPRKRRRGRPTCIGSPPSTRQRHREEHASTSGRRNRGRKKMRNDPRYHCWYGHQQGGDIPCLTMAAGARLRPHPWRRLQRNIMCHPTPWRVAIYLRTQQKRLTHRPKCLHVGCSLWCTGDTN